MGWFFLILAGIFEIIWVVILKHSDGFNKIIPSIVMMFTMLMSFLFLSFSLKTVPLSTAYAVWSGIAIIGTVIFGILWFEETADTSKIICIVLITMGIIGLKML